MLSVGGTSKAMIVRNSSKSADPTFAGLYFLRSELKTGLTLTKIALDARHLDKTSRNRVNARKAYDAVVHFAPRVNLSPEESDEIKSKLEHLKSQLKLLGEEL
jgi:hypothetical protein